MTCKDLAEQLLTTPGAYVLLEAGGNWVEVVGVEPAENHRNAVTLTLGKPVQGERGDDPT